MTITNRRPIRVVSNQREDNDPVVLPDRLQQQARHAERRIVIVRPDRKYRFHIGHCGITKKTLHTGARTDVLRPTVGQLLLLA